MINLMTVLEGIIERCYGAWNQSVWQSITIKGKIIIKMPFNIIQRIMIFYFDS